MRVLIVVIALHLCGACGKSAEEKKKEELAEQEKAAADDPSTTPPTSVTVDPSVPPQYVFANSVETEWMGNGHKAIEGVALKRGGAAFTFNHDGESNFAVQLLKSSGQKVKLLQNEIGKVDGATVFVEVDGDGAYMFEVEADGAWSIKAVAIQLGSALPSGLEGTGSTVPAAFTLKKDHAYMMTSTHDGKSNFAITLYDAVSGDFEDLLENEIGKYSGESVISVRKAGHYVLGIEADGKWSVTVK